MKRRTFIRNLAITTPILAFMPYFDLIANPLAGKVKITNVNCVLAKIGMRVSPLVKITTDAGLVGIGECHHDEKNQPLDSLQMGDNVQNCIECHKIPGEKPKGKDAPKLTRQQELEYHAEAIHDNCRGCHKAHNKEKGLKSKDPGYAPTSCKDCHPKE